MSERVDKEWLLQQIRSIADNLGTESVPRNEFLRRTGVSERQIYNHFGSYNELVKAAGLQPNVFPTAETPKYSDDELLAEMIRVFRLPNAKLTRMYFDLSSSGGKASVIERRFGGWINAVRQVKSLLDPDSDKELINRIAEYASPQSPTPATAEFDSLSINEDSDRPLTPVEDLQHELLGSNSNLYGDFINFRGLQHAPVNEQGVVFLFGMICKELGYIVEIVRSGFPDCEAKRRLRGKSGLWQRVRIEFEFQSRSFRAHGHDPDQCDVIVCWEDNWSECPIEVLELRGILKSLPSDVSR